MSASAQVRRPERLFLAALSGLLGALPDHVGQYRVANAYLGRRRLGHQLLEQRMRGGLRVSLDLGDRTQGLAYLTRRYEPELIDFIVARLPRGGTFVDIGAHVGLIALAVAARRPDAVVLGFEPSEANARAWRANRELNGLANAELVQRAVADRAGPMRFHAAEDSAAGYLGDGDGTVDVTTLDRVAADRNLRRIDVLKIDTEGGEVAVLDGAAGLLSAGAIRTVICELNSVHLARHGQRGEDVVARLERAGLRQVALPAGRSRLRRGPAMADAAVVRDAAFELATAPAQP